MSEPELPKTETPNGLPAVPPGKPKRTFTGMLRDVFLERYPEAKPVHAYLGERMPGMRLKRWVFYSGLTLILSVSIGVAVHYTDKNVTNSKISATNDFFTRSNSFLLGRIDQIGQDVVKLQKSADDLKTDLNEEKREKDVLQQRVTFLESLPTTAAAMYSNMLAITNAFSGIDSGRPEFDLYVNNTLVTNGSIISLKESRKMQFRVVNKAQTTAEQLSVVFSAPFALDKTNVIAGSEWLLQPPTVSIINGTWTTNAIGNTWRWMADKSVAGVSGYCPETIDISTNFSSQIWPVVQVSFFVFSNRSNTQKINVALTF